VKEKRNSLQRKTEEKKLLGNLANYEKKALRFQKGGKEGFLVYVVRGGGKPPAGWSEGETHF